MDCRMMEMSSFLKELGCPFTFLFEGKPDERLRKGQHRAVLLHYLLDEILAARLTR
jgi:hypothetical protein